MQFILSKAAMLSLKAIVASLFDRARLRLLGKKSKRNDVLKGKAPEYIPHASVPGVFDEAAASERMRPNEQLRDAVNKVTEGYLNVQQELATTQVVHAVQSFLSNAESGHKTNVNEVLKEELNDIMGKVTDNVKKIAETETTKARNASSIDAVGKIAAAFGIQDPVVAFLTVRDDKCCSECKRVHLLEDGITPRVFKMSEVNHGYHKKGENAPSVSGIHPRCRCTCVSMLPGYGFDESGGISFIAIGHDEWKKQRG
jgi:hypothetical protein